jgi:hypothetical protein
MRFRHYVPRLLASLLGGGALPLLLASVAAACSNGSGFPH